MCIYNTPMNTIGVGDPVPYGIGECGSGDLYGGIFPKMPKSPKRPKAPKLFGKKGPQNYGMQLPIIVMAKQNKRTKK